MGWPASFALARKGDHPCTHACIHPFIHPSTVRPHTHTHWPTHPLKHPLTVPASHWQRQKIRSQDEAKQLETLNKKNQKQQAQPLTYDQLRTRLPRSIGDDIVRLLADNYDALGDFASIQTQADVDNFNLKYQVNLVLPQEA